MADTMCWPDPGEELAIKTIILDKDFAAKRTTKRWVRDMEDNVGSDV
jgi:hypothetical protein